MSIKPALCRHGNLARSCPICEEIADAQIRLDERRKIIDEKDAEIARRKAELSVAQSFHDVAVKERNLAYAEVASLKAEVERLKERECPRCYGGGRVASTWEGRAVNIDCPNCGGTGRAR